MRSILRNRCQNGRFQADPGPGRFCRCLQAAMRSSAVSRRSRSRASLFRVCCCRCSGYAQVRVGCVFRAWVRWGRVRLLIEGCGARQDAGCALGGALLGCAKRGDWTASFHDTASDGRTKCGSLDFKHSTGFLGFFIVGEWTKSGQRQPAKTACTEQ